MSRPIKCFSSASPSISLSFQSWLNMRIFFGNKANTKYYLGSWIFSFSICDCIPGACPSIRADSAFSTYVPILVFRVSDVFLASTSLAARNPWSTIKAWSSNLSRGRYSRHITASAIESTPPLTARPVSCDQSLQYASNSVHQIARTQFAWSIWRRPRKDT